MLEILKLTPLFRSKFGRFRFPDPPGKPAEPWESVIRRLPALDPEESKSHIQIVYKGKILPYSGWNLRQSGSIQYWIYSEFCGPPKAAKTVALGGIHRLFKKWNLTYVIYPELRRIDIPEFHDPILENVWRANRAVNNLLISYDEQTSGHGFLNRMRNFIFRDLGIMNSVMFADALAELTGRTAYRNEIIASAAPYIGMMDAATLLHVPPETSVSRGSRLGLERLTALSRARENLPAHMERMTRTSDRPLLFINIDTRNHDKKGLPLYIARTYGTIIRDWVQ